MTEIDGKTRTCGLIGNPVEHTLSPLIHNTLAEELGCDMVYVPFRVEQGQLENAVRGAYGLNLLGLNVTVPYKQEVMPYLADIDALAQKIGAVNTLVRTAGGYKGYNTDMSGLLRAMKSDGIVIQGEEIILLGAGGAGRMAAFLCAANGAKRVYLLNRSEEKAVRVAGEVNTGLSTDCVVPMGLDGYRSLSGADGKYLIIQGTSIGLSPNVEDTAIEDERFYRCAKAGYDLIYNPWETKFMRLVRAAGAEAYNGLKMLLYQAVDAFELWNDCKVPEERALSIYEALRERMRK
ncbi:MAG: shikimate dehydrogenase [Roseburia sp.]|nr:shikimate dehydrogenase [Roseburia sp.]